ncbi:D-amino-acid dehydrogenase [Litoreibacter ponti]|uniref:D-amino-acid dehydrogenase n=1 Tax=Litoreibacter ponti TaxID=1510457 RepID=A0A2T6BJ06_9RHOB|nr:D-amino acid dehydrogenase [Litoreibacter ponti]PTX56032.1 D-amino-acid dehydrogenase [Litoreibacter ponti]
MPHKTPHIAVLGAGITGTTMAYKLLDRGFDVTIIDRQPYAAMETSYANGGQLSASNAEVWNSWGTVLKGMKWLLKKDAPLSMNLSPSWHKYSWLAEFVAAIPQHRQNTLDTVRMARIARGHLLDMAERAGIDFDLERRGILHVYKDAREFDAGRRATKLLAEGGLERREVTPDEIAQIEPALPRGLIGGFFTDSDFTGDIHKFSNGLARDFKARGGRVLMNTVIEHAVSDGKTALLDLYQDGVRDRVRYDGVVVSAGIGSRALGAQFGDRVNVYPVKGYSITVNLDDTASQQAAPWVSLLDEKAKIVTSRLGKSRFRIAGTAEFNGANYDIRADRVKPLVEWCRSNFPDVCTENTVPWAGLRPMMPNMVPHLGQGRLPNVFYNTGHGHLGWTLSAATAETVSAAMEARYFGTARPTQITGGLTHAAA